MESHAEYIPDKKLEEELVVYKRRLAELEANYRISVEKEKELQERLIASNSDVAKWEAQYSTIVERKTEMEHELTILQKVK